MDIQIYNSLTRKKEIFKPVEKGVLKMYSCGPTVYDYVHIGNLRAYFFMDLICRVFKFNGYKIQNVMNITDVGHLVSDGDEGEDKMIKAAKKEKKSPFDIARFYEKEFLKDIDKLNILRPWKIVRATEHIKPMEEFVKVLLENGFAYKTKNTIYFDTSKVNNGKPILARQIEGKKAGARIEVDKEKKNPEDFALWIKAPENHIMKWDSFFGKAYPGWHLECSVMSEMYLGKIFDIHTGGTDHIPVHHENEIKQSMGKNNCVPSNYFMHVDFLQVDGTKMSKSLGNIYTLETLEDKGYHPLDFRYFLMQTSYRKLMNFTFESLNASKMALENLRKIYIDLNEKVNEDTEKLKEDNLKRYDELINLFNEAINDDLNITKALSIVWDVVKDSDISDNTKLAFLKKVDEVLGLDLENSEKYVKLEKEVVLDDELKELLDKRKKAREDKDFALSDKIRDILKEKGYIVIDTKDGMQVLNKE